MPAGLAVTTIRQVLGRELVKRAAQHEPALTVGTDLVDVVGEHGDALAAVQPAPQRVRLLAGAHAHIDLALEGVLGCLDDPLGGLAAQRHQYRHDPDPRQQLGEPNQRRRLA